MSMMPKATVIAVVLMAWSPAASVERTTTINRETVVCVNWAGWREYGLASMTARGAQMSKTCPARLAAGTKVVVADEDAGAGASEIRYRGKTWFIDSQRLK